MKFLLGSISIRISFLHVRAARRSPVSAETATQGSVRWSLDVIFCLAFLVASPQLGGPHKMPPRTRAQLEAQTRTPAARVVKREDVSYPP